MSKAAKQSILILAVLLLGSFGFVGYTLMEKQKVDQAKAAMEKELEAYQKREKDYILENKDLTQKLKEAEALKKKAEEGQAAAQEQLSTVDDQIKALNDRIAALTQEKEENNTKLETLQKERLELLVKLKEKPKPKTIIKYIEKEPAQKEETEEPKTEVSLDELGDSYWAGVLKEKAALELELGKVNSDLSTTILQLEDLRKVNSDRQIEFDKLKNEKEEIVREIKNSKDLADALSLELARAKGDRKFVQDRLDKFKTENNELRDQIKKLTSTKVALEKSIVKITEDKNSIQKKLFETESVIQGKIEEIWRIKESLNKTLNPSESSASREIELSPIVVSAQNVSAQEDVPEDQVGFNNKGNIVSLNEENNFVIIDMGKKSGVKVGNRFGVYRGVDYIAEVEVIQVREDICAADIRQKAKNIKVGDIVR